jgi:pimeloyl-ACP methyl ester carboxylesterase
MDKRSPPASAEAKLRIRADGLPPAEVEADIADLIFDRSGRLARPSLRLLVGNMRAFLLDPPPGLPQPEVPRGDGHLVLVFPPFLFGDGMTRPLRRYLDACGYETHGWGLGRNLGPSDAIMEGGADRLAELHASTGRRVSLVGVSLGGLFAREAAKRHPLCVRRVITLCSPYRLPIASNMEPVFRLLAERHSHNFAHLLPTLAVPPPVPTTSVYTKDDGIVNWRSCADPDDPEADNVEVQGAHATIGRNPRALAVMTERLARPEGCVEPGV